MKALVLAAGIGSRLAPLTETTPKALVTIKNKPMLQIILDKLSICGFNEIVINLFHHTDQVLSWLDNYQKNKQIELIISKETKLLDTGGGIKKMLNFFRTNEPVLVHNVDIISGINLQELYTHHCHTGAAATLALQTRKTSRPLLFDESLHLCGRLHPRTANYTIVTKPTGHVSNFSFCGIQIIDPNLFLKHPAVKFYSIDVYLKAAAAGKIIKGVVFDEIYWKDLGTPAAIKAAEEDIDNSLFSL